ncbi:tripartite tricarboxylate transporter substrate binding protein [Peribacillus cavernae]|uniref:Tripartite tricarboxylate transporter substrate binding protein n=1 Tax=Peribacillus cavernae TaxID=1674310 RepID=A0A3S1BCA9_9BACI|nr:tripartite tricarboxylate transporter substrate binding protein [Peribacillus cavernae]MDQ0218163.1 tripartite-type tricarboxylate transporter receptor subunit TctC [Peribacillus cavernae]RUQ32690.1 tripartite tricarboxylate transporter substrate binding protein [Peribacillus cavernae]
MISKKLIAIFCTILLAGSILAGCASSESKTSGSAAKGGSGSESDYPTKPIELVIPYAAGGGTDVTARILAKTVSKYLPNKQTIVPVNKPGASGTLGLAELYEAKPDGYKISMATIGNIAIQPNYGNTPYSYDSFEPLLIATSVPHVLLVKKDAPWKTVDEWFEYVKKNPNSFSYSTPGKGNTQHLNLEGIALKDGLKLKHVPFDGAAPAITALLGGHVEGAVVQVHEAKPHVDSGTLRILANTGTTKSESIKDAEFLEDKGYSGLNAWTGIVAPKGIPEDVKTTLHDAFKKALEDPETIEQFKKIGIEPAYSNPEDFKKTIEDTNKTTGDIAKKVGL